MELPRIKYSGGKVVPHSIPGRGLLWEIKSRKIIAIKSTFFIVTK
jgi:hypothetical protein